MFSFYYCFFTFGLLKNVHQTFVHKYSPRTVYIVRKLIVFFAVVALRLLKYAGHDISYSKSNVL